MGSRNDVIDSPPNLAAVGARGFDLSQSGCIGQASTRPALPASSSSAAEQIAVNVSAMPSTR